jgi:hypothetical protein
MTVYAVDQYVRVGFDDCRRRRGIFSTDALAREWIAAQQSGDYDVTPVVVDALASVAAPADARRGYSGAAGAETKETDVELEARQQDLGGHREARRRRKRMWSWRKSDEWTPATAGRGDEGNGCGVGGLTPSWQTPRQCVKLPEKDPHAPPPRSRLGLPAPEAGGVRGVRNGRRDRPARRGGRVRQVPAGSGGAAACPRFVDTDGLNAKKPPNAAPGGRATPGGEGRRLGLARSLRSRRRPAGWPLGRWRP